MKARKTTGTTKRLKRSQPRLTKAEVEALVEEATVDCNNESEQATGLYTMIEDNLQLPFETEVLGVPLMVNAIDITEDDQIIAVCKLGSQTQKILILDIPLPTPRPPGSEWIEAYRVWSLQDRTYKRNQADKAHA